MTFRRISGRQCLLLILYCGVCYGLGTKIAPKSYECFSESVEPGCHLAFSFEVTSGGEKDIDVVLTSTSVQAKDDSVDAANRITSLNHQVYTKEIERWTKATEGRAAFTSPTKSESGHGLPTKVTACFSNKMSQWTPKWISFQLFSDPADPTGDLQSVQTVESELEHALHKEGNNLFQLRSLMQKLKNVEQEHRNQVESTNEWVLYGTVINGLLLIAMSVFQFWYLKRFLSIRSVSMRL